MVVYGERQICEGRITVPICDGTGCRGGRACCVNDRELLISKRYIVIMECASNGRPCLASYTYGPIEVPTSCTCD